MITIHMTTHRHFASGLLRRAIESVLSQDFADFEFIVCDDASADGTAAYLAQVASADRRVKVFHNARNVDNAAISLGRCMQRSDAARPWVSWMFDNRALLPGALSHLVAALRTHPAPLIVCDATNIYQKAGMRTDGPSEADVEDRTASIYIHMPHGGMLVHRDVFARVGFLDSSVILRGRCEEDLFSRINRNGIEFLTLPAVLMGAAEDPKSDTINSAEAVIAELIARFIAARDSWNVRLDLENVLARPVDWIPPASWSTEDLNLMRYMFTEYFLSVGDIARAFRWSRILSEGLDSRGQVMRDKLLRDAVAPAPVAQRAMAAGAFAGIVLGAWREQRGGARC